MARTIESLRLQERKLRQAHKDQTRDGQWEKAQTTRRKLIETLNQLSELQESGAVDLIREVTQQMQDNVHRILSECGCPTGNEHGNYSLEERIRGLAAVRDSLLRTVDTYRKTTK